MPSRNSRGDGEGIREGRMVVYRGVPARVIAVHHSTPHPLNRPRIIGAELYLPGQLAEVPWATVDEIDAPAPTPVNSDGIRVALATLAPEVAPLVGRITSSRHYTTVRLDISAVYRVYDSQRPAADAIAAALVPAWHDAETRIAVRADDGEAWVQVYRDGWFNTTPVRQWVGAR